MSREWEPGDVALVDSWRGKGQLACRTQRGEAVGWCVLDGEDTRGLDDLEVTATRPVVVIDPEDREQVELLIHAYDDAYNIRKGRPLNARQVESGVGDLQAALRSLVTPKPEVYEHLVYADKDGTASAMCGKVWQPDRAGVTVLGKCPECTQLSIGGWVA